MRRGCIFVTDSSVLLRFLASCNGATSHVRQRPSRSSDVPRAAPSETCAIGKPCMYGRSERQLSSLSAARTGMHPAVWAVGENRPPTRTLVPCSRLGVGGRSCSNNMCIHARYPRESCLTLLHCTQHRCLPCIGVTRREQWVTCGQHEGPWTAFLQPRRQRSESKCFLSVTSSQRRSTRP